MNSLSWLLYLGNVAGNAGGALIFFGIALFVGAVIATVVVATENEALTKAMLRYNHHPETKPVMKLKSYWATYMFLFFMFVCWTLAIFCPNQQTVYAIAASQVGEMAIKTPLASKAEQALESWLDHQIKSNTSTTSDNDSSDKKKDSS